MMQATLSNAPRALSRLRLFPLVAALMLVAADGARADDSRGPQLHVQAGQQAQPDRPGESDAPARGQEHEDDWKFSIGAAAIYAPAFLGSEDYQALAVPDIKVEYKDEFFASLFGGVGYNVINRVGLRVGPIMKFDFGRTEDDDNPFRIAGEKTDALKGLGDVDATVELGGFLEYEYGMFSYTLELRQGAGGHEGLVGETGVDFKDSMELLGKPVFYSIGPRLKFADSNYNNAFFGITRAQSARSGLARYDADAGLVSYGIGAFTVIPLADSVSLGVFGGYDRLAGVAADSPLIKERGDENQFTGGVRIVYEFGYSSE